MNRSSCIGNRAARGTIRATAGTSSCFAATGGRHRRIQRSTLRSIRRVLGGDGLDSTRGGTTLRALAGLAGGTAGRMGVRGLLGTGNFRRTLTIVNSSRVGVIMGSSNLAATGALRVRSVMAGRARVPLSGVGVVPVGWGGHYIVGGLYCGGGGNGVFVTSLSVGGLCARIARVTSGTAGLSVGARILHGVTRVTALRVSNMISVTGGGCSLGSTIGTGDPLRNVGVRDIGNTLRVNICVAIGRSTSIGAITRGIRRGIGSGVRAVADATIAHIGIIITSVVFSRCASRRRWWCLGVGVPTLG